MHRGLAHGVICGLCLELERGDGAVGDAAGNDEVKVAQVGGDVEGEAVRGDALGDVDAECGDLLFLNRAVCNGPDTGAAGDALRGDAEVVADADENLFEHAHEVDGAEV